MAGTGQVHGNIGNQLPVPGQMAGPSGMHPQQGGMSSMQPNIPVQPQVVQITETDPVAKFKSLLPRLKESLVTLFKIGGHLFYQNASQDETGVQMDNVSGKFEKCLEEFYAICDQMEIYMRLAYEIIQQDKDSNKNTPNLVLPPKGDTPQPEGQVYSQYLSTIRAQITCAKDIRDLLHECLKNFPEHSHS